MSVDYSPLQEIIDGGMILNAPMKQYTTWKIGGPADCLIEPKNSEDIVAVVRFAREHQVPLFVLGNGSNLLVSDDGIEGIVLHCGDSLAQFSFAEVSDDTVLLTAGSGALLTKMARETAKRGLAGLQWSVGIPASLGGAAIMNAGAYGHCFYEVLSAAEIVTENGETARLSGDELGWSYRHTALMDRKTIVTGVELRLTKGDRDELMKTVDETIKLRREKQPLDFPSAGSVFKNPEGSHAGYLVELTGLRGMRVGNAEVSEKHGNFILNKGDCTAKDVLTLIDQVRREVKQAQGYDLVPEVKLVGRF